VPERQLKLIATLETPKDIRRQIELARLAEAARFDAVLLDDLGLEPTAALAAVATATTHIGLIAAITTTYNEPYNVARRLLSVDHISEGRAGWHLIATGNPNETPRFGFDLDAAGRDARAAEFYDVVAALWDSWEDDALLRDKVGGDYMDRDKVHFLDHVGAHFKVRGPLNIARSAQAWPVVAQSPVSDAGRTLAARGADVILTAPATLAEAKTAYADLKARAVRAGRSTLIMPAIPQTALAGNAEAVADVLASWFAGGAADGFQIALTEEFAREVIPVLQRRGLVRVVYAGTTLRRHLGLPVPENRYTAKRKQA
jgi:N-acetyl-S-(2-succino)cysteine monooxygenase